MALAEIRCIKCRQPFRMTTYTPDRRMICPGCYTEHEVHLFPAFVNSRAGFDRAETVLLSDEVSCFNHPDKRAVVSCDGCGRFLCALCRVDWSGKNLCLQCLESMRRQGTDDKLKNRRILYDDIALALAVLPLIFWPITIATAPAALYYVIRYWNRSPTSLVPRTRIRFILAALFSLPQLAAWAFVIVGLAMSWG